MLEFDQKNFAKNLLIFVAIVVFLVTLIWLSFQLMWADGRESAGVLNNTFDQIGLN